MRRIAAALLLVVLFGASAPEGANSDPAAVTIYTSDIPRFWQAFDDAANAPSPQDAALVYGREYFAPGSDGLWGFVPQRLISPRRLVRVLTRDKAQYERVRPYTLTLEAAKPRIVADFATFKRFDPDAVFPNIYFVIGANNSGGTSVDRVGLIMGAEVLFRPARFDPALLPPSDPASQTKIFDAIVPLVVHENVHYNQDIADQKTLLDSTITEGMADFLAQLADGSNPGQAYWQFGCDHENALWALFAKQMGATDDKTIADWLFGGDKPPLGAPDFVGYWMGYRIVQSYYDRAPDKLAAIHAMLHVQNYAAFLKGERLSRASPALRPDSRVVDLNFA